MKNGTRHERKAKENGYRILIGVDEAGRGPLAGPVVVAAVYLKTFSFASRVDDSKKLSPLQRRRAFDEISKVGSYGIGIINESAIDDIRISKALVFATDAAINSLIAKVTRPRPTFKNTFLLFDGTLSSTLKYPSKEIIGGDAKSVLIAAASIVAKVTRDRIMDIYSRVWPEYGFQRHKGYGTAEHMHNIARYGSCPIHRKSFLQKLPR